MKISVIVCTHNRAASLERTLKSLVSQSLPQEEYEVRIVDNASTDDTKAVAAACAQQRNVHYMYTSTPGLSRARNIGWQAAQADLVAFLDDDAVADPEWLAQMLRAYTYARATHMVLAGKVLLDVPSSLPPWLPEELLFTLGKLELGDTFRDITGSVYFAHGCNMTLPRRTLEHVGGFSEQLGRKGTRLLSGGEILLQQRVTAAGGRIHYVPGAAVHHHVPLERLQRRWFMRRLFWEGRSLARIEKEQHRLRKGTLLFSQLDALRRNLSWDDIMVPMDKAERFAWVCRKLRRAGGLYEALLPR